MIRLFYLSIITFCILPLIPGMLGIVLPALSWLPALGLRTPSLSAFFTVANWPGLGQSVALTLFTGIGGTALALSCCFFILRTNWGHPRWQRIERLIAPMLALPHVAFAIGFTFALAPTGWIIRVFHLIGFETDTWWSLSHGSYGIGLMLALAIKETPFLLLMSISVLQQLRLSRPHAVATSLGYSRSAIWLKVVLPQWLPKMRMPIYAVLAYGLSVVDIAMILGPTRPPTLSVLVWHWFNDPDLTLMPRAAVGALLLLLVALSVLAIARILEWLIIGKYRRWQTSGSATLTNAMMFPCFVRRAAHWILARLHWLFFIVPIVVIPLLIIWSIARRWRFPELLPSQYSGYFWQQESASLISLAATSTVLAIISATIAMILAIGCLEYRQHLQRDIPTWLIALPMVTPQLSLLFGIQVSAYTIDSYISGQLYSVWVIWSHVLFTFPYLYLSLDGPWRSYDTRLNQVASSLGLAPWSTWWRVKFPLMLPAIIIGFAVGMSVSLAQYLPTQILGAGRITTLTTEAVALASGQDRRVSAIYGLLQGLLPLGCFIIAIFASRYVSHALSRGKFPKLSLADSKSP